MQLTPVSKTPFSLASPIPPPRRAPTRLTLKDHLAAIALRLGIGRTRATIEPGLHAIGAPQKDSPVLVSANYRLTFDTLRRELGGRNLWLLIVDTKGINVWCAAGKGSFSAKEVARRVRLTGLDRMAPDAPLILPQLAASGVDAFSLAKDTGRRVLFGPVRARDIPTYLDAGMIADDSMRKISFTLRERSVLAPLELVHAWPFYPGAAILALLLALPTTAGFSHRFLWLLIYLEGSIFAGALFVPLLLPAIPGRFFSIKGGCLNLVWSVLWFAAALMEGPWTLSALSLSAGLPLLAALLAGTATAAYLAMNFTGCSTFTSQKGTELEVSKSLPAILLCAGIAVLASLAHAAIAIITRGTVV